MTPKFSLKRPQLLKRYQTEVQWGPHHNHYFGKKAIVGKKGKKRLPPRNLSQPTPVALAPRIPLHALRSTLCTRPLGHDLAMKQTGGDLAPI
jgi:hypothetical protein